VNDQRHHRDGPASLHGLRQSLLGGFLGASAREHGKPDERFVSLLAPSSFEAEQYRGLRYVIEESGKHVVAITSPTPGDGKTTTAINLAGALAQDQGTRVLLAEVDLRQPRVGEQLGLPRSGAPGFADAVADDRLALSDVVQHVAPFHLWVLLAGRSPDGPYEVLKSPRLEQLLDEARQQYDYVVLDTPPVVPVPDTRLIARGVDGLLIVVSAHQTSRTLLEEALAALGPTKVLGLVFNRDDDRRRGYYGYEYYSSSPEPKGRRWRRRGRATRERLGGRG